MEERNVIVTEVINVKTFATHKKGINYFIIDRHQNDRLQLQEAMNQSITIVPTDIEPTEQ